MAAPTPEATALFARAQSAWPGLRVTAERFFEQLAHHHHQGEVPFEAVDFYLACACVDHLPGALELFERTHLQPLINALERRHHSRPLAEEVVQELRTRLLVGPQPQLASYSGRGSLKGWLKVSATREALALQRRQGREVGLSRVESDDAHALPVSALPPELELLRARCHAEFGSAFNVAFTALSARQRNLLRHAFHGGLSTEQLGVLYAVHRATAARWLQTAREALAERVRQELGARLKLTESECVSLLHVVVSQLDASLPQLIERTHSSSE
jgi:RNA polymerase sigma-70 factor (ECF subfamily)